MKMYEAQPGAWLCQGVTWEDHRAAMAANWNGDWREYEVQGIVARNDEARRWVTKDGRVIQYEDLEPGHLENIVEMVKRNHKAMYFPNLMKHWVNRRAK
jgi:hypothetical protein